MNEWTYEQRDRAGPGPARPVYVGTTEAIAAAHAGREVAVSPCTVDGAPALRVRLLAPAGGAAGATQRRTSGPTAAAAQTRSAGPYRRIPAHIPDDVINGPALKARLLTDGQKWTVIIGGVLVVLLGLVWVVMQAISAIVAMIAGAGAGIAGLVIVGVIAWMLVNQGGGGGTTTVNIGAKVIKHVRL